MLLLSSACAARGRVPTSTSPGTEVTAPTPRPANEIKALGKLVPIDALVAAAWDGEKLWLLDVERRLISVDGDTGIILSRTQLEVELSDQAGLLPLGQDLVGVGRGQEDERVRLVRINRAGAIKAIPVSQGLPLGQAAIVDKDTLIVADYSLGIVSIQPETGAVSPIINPGFVVGLVRPVGDSFWVVDDSRSRLALLTADGGRRFDDIQRGHVTALAADSAGNAWTAEQTLVTVFNQSGQKLHTFGAFTNASRISYCSDMIVASDVETGRVSWLTADGVERRLDTNRPGSVVSCAGRDVWFVDSDGETSRMAAPSGP